MRRIRIRIKDHLEWAESIACKVARRSHVYDSTIDELISVAYLQLVKQVRRFDPSLLPAGGDLVGLFRGFSFRPILSECIGEVRRLRGGGLFTRRVRRPVVCESLSELALSKLAVEPAMPDEQLDSVLTPITVEPKPDAVDEIEAANRRLYLRAQLRALAAAADLPDVRLVFERNQQLSLAGRLDAKSWREIRTLTTPIEVMTLDEVRTAARKRLKDLKRDG